MNILRYISFTKQVRKINTIEEKNKKLGDTFSGQCYESENIPFLSLYEYS